MGVLQSFSLPWIALKSIPRIPHISCGTVGKVWGSSAGDTWDLFISGFPWLHSGLCSGQRWAHLGCIIWGFFGIKVSPKPCEWLLNLVNDLAAPRDWLMEGSWWHSHQHSHYLYPFISISRSFVPASSAWFGLCSSLEPSCEWILLTSLEQLIP